MYQNSPFILITNFFAHVTTGLYWPYLAKFAMTMKTMPFARPTYFSDPTIMISFLRVTLIIVAMYRRISLNNEIQMFLES